MQNHRQLRVYGAAQRLAREVYSLALRLPPSERHALADQLRRGAVSVVSNIAEGCGRSTGRDFASFLDKSLGAAKEIEAQLLHGWELGLLPADSARHAIVTSIAVQRMLTGLILKVRPDRRSGGT